MPLAPLPLVARSSGMDPDAATYISAIEGDGVSVSAAQKAAINAFYGDIKASGVFSDLTRYVLPIWSNATANARCLVSHTSGTFSGGVTHSLGHIAGNGTDAFYQYNGNADAILPSNTDLNYGMLLVSAATNSSHSYNGTGTSIYAVSMQPWGDLRTVGATGVGFSAVVASGVLTPVTGFWALDFDGSSRKLISRIGGANVVQASNATASADTVKAQPFGLLARLGGTSNVYSDAEIGAGWTGGSMGEAGTSSLLTASQALWEGCTGLTLP